MLTPKPQLNLRNAKSYFREHLAVGDYYTEGHAVAGQWRGGGSAMLGLSGAVTEEEFLRLCDGLHPKTGEWLTVRRKTSRRVTRHVTRRDDLQDEEAAREGEKEGLVSNRRVFYDFTISPPKSVSIVALYQDARIIAVHDAAARVMLDELEKFAETRVRRGGANSERVTGGVVGALFRHDTSRELDPHLHTHCILFNATFDNVENRWKALHATGMYRAQKFAENLYYHELAKGLRALGYEIENNARDFEIKGVPADIISRFSKRHHQINEETRRLIETEKSKGCAVEEANGNIEGVRGAKNIKDLREQVAHDKRRRKIKNTPTEHLRPHWELQMSAEERRALASLTPEDATLSPADATASATAVKPSSFVGKLSALVAKWWHTEEASLPPNAALAVPVERQKEAVPATPENTGVPAPTVVPVDVPATPEKPGVSEFLEWAQKHTFERQSVITDHALLALALARGRGENFSLEELRAEFEASVKAERYFRDQRSPDVRTAHKITSREALRREWNIVFAAQDGRNRHAPFCPPLPQAALPPSLSAEQPHAVAGILRSRDFITLFQGGAGTGKSFTLREVVRGLKAHGHPVVVAAPQNQQAADLQRDGLEGASTLARLLAANASASSRAPSHAPSNGSQISQTIPVAASPAAPTGQATHAKPHSHSAQKLPPGAVVILDEAGQVGASDMLALIHAVKARNGRLILSGDTRQHGAVAAGDALRIIEEHTDLQPMRLKTIRRQDPDKVSTVEEKRFVRQYRKAVEAASDGRLSDSFNLLDEAGCVRELTPEDRRKTLAREYCAALARGEKVLVVAPTWDEVREVNAAIRERLVAEGRLGNLQEEATGRPINSANAPDSTRSASSPAKPGKLITSWQSLDLSEAQKQDARFYPPNAKVFFVRQYGRFEKGDACEIAGFSEHGVKLRKAAPLRDDERETTVSFQHASRFIVATPREIPVAPGERLQMKFNGKSSEGSPIRNGELVTVQRVRADGRIVVRDDNGERKTLKADQRLFVPGYAVTSYSSQGKTVDTVLVSYAGVDAEKAASAMPVNRNQWYVAISRARKKVLVLTGDKEALRVRVEQEGRRESALSLLPGLTVKVPAQAAGMMAKSTPAEVPQSQPNLQPGVEPDAPSKPSQTRTASSGPRPRRNTCPPFPRAVQADVERGLQTQRQAMLESFFKPAKHPSTPRTFAEPVASPAPAHQRHTLLEKLEHMDAEPAPEPESTPVPAHRPLTLHERLEQPLPPMASHSTPATTGRRRSLMETLEQTPLPSAPSSTPQSMSSSAVRTPTLAERLRQLDAAPEGEILPLRQAVKPGAKTDTHSTAKPNQEHI